MLRRIFLPWRMLDELRTANCRLEIQVIIAEQATELAEKRLADEVARTTYWRTRAEKLIDGALSKVGALTEPIMTTKEPSELEKGMRSVVGAMGMTAFPKGA